VSTRIPSTTWHVRGTYLEVCNCDAICPCRRVDGVPGGRSSYGECMGALSWQITGGVFENVELAGLGVVLALWYSDDEPGSPWSWILHVDDRGDRRQRAALEDIFSGRAGGSALRQFPWASNPSNQLAVFASRIETDHTPGRGWFRAGSHVDVRVAAPVETESSVSCGLPGHDRGGRELIAERLTVEHERLAFSYSGRCGFESTFDYASG
jgi:hypothetical protein